MKKFFLIIVTICFCVISAQGQFKMNANGKMYLGPPWKPSTGQHDSGDVLSGSVFGTVGEWKGSSKLAFGDFGIKSSNGWNVFIGEYGATNGADDKLWLHGKWGIYLTTGGQAQYDVAYCTSATSAPPNDFYFRSNIEVWAKKFSTFSDIRLKHNVKEIEQPLSKLLSLTGHTYDYDDQIRQDLLMERHLNKTALPDEEIVEDYEYDDSGKTEPVLPDVNNKCIGFIAQEVQKIFPDLVREDDLGFLGIDYIGIIPVIVEAMKEQQRMIDQQNRRIEELEMRLAELGGDVIPPKSSAPAVIEETENTTTNASLYQNVPNPFNQQTEIRFFLPEQVRSATIYIYDMQGKQIKNIPISQRGDSKVIISASELKAGTYLYSLVADQKEVGTLKMILTK